MTEARIDTFLAWAARRQHHYARLARLKGMGNAEKVGRARLLEEIGWRSNSGTRRLHRWEHDREDRVVRPRDWECIEAALEHAGLRLWDIYDPEQLPADDPLSTGYCRSCRERVLTDRTRHCLWCDGPTQYTRLHAA